MRVANWLGWIVGVFGLVLMAATLLPIIPSNEWWIRFFYFPRAQIAILLFLLLAIAVAAAMWRTRGGQALIVALTLCLGYQGARILPYTPPWPEEVPSAASCAPGDRLRYMEANVLQSTATPRHCWISSGSSARTSCCSPKRIDGGPIRSGHLPILVELCAFNLVQATLPPVQRGAETKEEVSETLEDGREESAAR